MRLGRDTNYVLTGTNPADYRRMSVGDVVGLNLEEPGGAPFRLSVRLTSIDVGKAIFEGVTIVSDPAQRQVVGGSFIDPA